MPPKIDKCLVVHAMDGGHGGHGGHPVFGPLGNFFVPVGAGCTGPVHFQNHQHGWIQPGDGNLAAFASGLGTDSSALGTLGMGKGPVLAILPWAIWATNATNGFLQWVGLGPTNLLIWR